MHALAFLAGWVAGWLYVYVDPQLPSFRRSKPQQRESGTTVGTALWTIAAIVEEKE